MSRIAKADVNRALQLAAKTIIDAGGPDGRTSRAEVKARLSSLPTEQRKLVDIFFKFIDNRDFKTGAQVTAKDVNRAVAYAKEHLVAKYDLDHNGLSKDEIAKMSLTGRRAIDLAKVLKAAGGSTGGPLTGAALASALTAVSKNVNYMSESDYTPVAVACKPASAAGVTADNVKAALGPTLLKFFTDGSDDDVQTMADMGIEVQSAAESKASLDDLCTFEPGTDAAYEESAKGFTNIRKVLETNLTDVRVVKVGPKETDGSLATDQGLYAYLLLGKTKDGQLAGVMYGSVET